MIRAPETRPAKVPARLAEWSGTDRYRARRCIGTGAVGAVYEALDAERNAVVAIKRLRHFSPLALYNLKQEFRTLADVRHPNLVRLYELVATEDREVFFTMELVRGVDFVAHVRPGGEPHFDALRDVLRQLTEGVQALHAAGKLHRDIKPSNVLVTPEGRVVLLDFGVATEQTRVRDEGPDDGPIVGTASYMAPEQAAGAVPTPASDWYAVGAVLFEALVGAAPFVGSVADVLKMKGSVTPPLPSSCAERVPPDLDALCASLLQRAPELRPDGAEILRLIGASKTRPSAAPAWRGRGTDAGGPSGLVGRDDQLRALRDAFEAARGRSIMVTVSGPAGAGKSSLVRDFLEAVAADDEAVILRGRAYERESVPYKAVDGWVDALSRHLLRQSERGALPPLPADISALARIFPVLRRVPEIDDVREPLTGDPHRMRRMGFGAMRELLGAMARRQPVVIHVDDAHWGDSDSAALILELVRPPQAPPLLLVMTCGEEGDGGPFLGELRSQWPPEAEAREVEVGALGHEDAARLALVLLGGDDAEARAIAQAVARESQGSPFLVEELVCGLQAAASAATLPGAPGAERPITLQQSVADRVARLPEDARALLETIAVGGRPLPVRTLSEAAGLANAEEVLEALRARRLVRVGLRDGRDTAETVHDRIRDAIVAGIPPERARSHSIRLARVLEATPDADVEAVALQLVGAGEKERAVPYAEHGADRAIAKLAFGRAAQLLRLAHEGTPPGTAEARRLLGRLAEALAWAGRSAEAAGVYLELAQIEGGDRRVELERAAAEQLLASGRIDEGAKVLRRVLAAIGTEAPRSVLASLAWFLFYRARLALESLRVKAREPADVRPADRARIEAMFAVALGFAVVDVLLGACMQARLLLLSLRLGDSEQILRAAALEAAQLATAGGVPGRRERALSELASRLADANGVESQALVEGSRGVAFFLRGRWKEALAAFDASSAMRPASRTQWSLNAVLFAVRCLYFSGAIKELGRRHARVAADARDRGDLYTVVNLASTTAITVHLAADDPEGARRQVHAAMAQWSQTGFLVQHFQAMAFEPDIDLYLGDGGAAHDRLMRDHGSLKKSFLLRVQFVRGIFHSARGRCAVAAAAARPERRGGLLDEARRSAGSLERERMPWTAALAALVRAAIANAENRPGAARASRPDEAVAALREAVRASEAAGMAMHAAAARYRLGERLGGVDGEELMRSAAEAIAVEGIRDVARWAAIFLPGSWGRGEHPHLAGDGRPC
jgi:hypothetical protein